MTLRRHPTRAACRLPADELELLGTPRHERLMMLDLVADLQRWPARNAVFRKALDRAAQDLARMASEIETR